MPPSMLKRRVLPAAAAYSAGERAALTHLADEQQILVVRQLVLAKEDAVQRDQGCIAGVTVGVSPGSGARDQGTARSRALSSPLLQRSPW